MTTTPIERLHAQLDNVSEKRTKLYFVTRTTKEGVKKTAKVLDKFDFKTYQVDIDDEIREELFDTASQVIRRLIEKETEYGHYTVINDGQHTLTTYPMTNKVMSFKKVVEEQLPGQPARIKSLSEVVGHEELWAYVIGMYTPDKEWVYAFRKILKNRVAVDPNDKEGVSTLKRALRTLFNTTTQKLELIEGDTVVLDKVVDCFYFEGEFYVHKQTQFEQIVGLEEEFKAEAEQVVGELEGNQFFSGVDVMRAMLEDKTMHKKLVRMSKLGLYRRVDAKAIKKMKSLAKKLGLTLKMKDDQFVMEDAADVDQVIKLLCAYYKRDEVFGDSYGTFSGTKIEVVAEA